MKVELFRTASNEDGTFGTLNLDGQPAFNTLEEKWLDNKKRVSCIPAGKYECIKYSGTKYKDVWKVKDVPNRTAILFHWGNTRDNTAGCILIGRQFSKFGSVYGIGRSREAFDIMRSKVPDQFSLHIYDSYKNTPQVFANPKSPAPLERFSKWLDRLIGEK